MATALLAIKHYSGLKKSEIQPLFKKFGKNTFNQRKHSGFLYAVWNIFKEPMFHHAAVCFLPVFHFR